MSIPEGGGLTTYGPRLPQRGVSPTVAAAVLIVVVVVVGGLGYAALSFVSPSGGSTTTHCAPPNAPSCSSDLSTNDVVLFVAFQPGIGQRTISVAEGQTLPATVSLSNGGAADNFTVFWGDGSSSTQTSPTFDHRYQSLGTFVVSAAASVDGATHTGTSYLFPVSVVPPLAATASGEYPTLTTEFSNGSLTGPNYPWINQGSTVSVSASYSAPPTAVGYSAGSPSIISTGGTQVSVHASPTGASATYSFSSAGLYQITMVGPVTGPQGTQYQNYTWSVYVGPSGVVLGCGFCRGSGAPGIASPHPGSLYEYEIVPGGAVSLDPAVDYETAGGEVIQNVYETLVQYNGSSTSSYVPVLSTCVPGPAANGPTSCESEYGSDLNVGDYWTFPIDAGARFYDPNTGRSWGVYPSDVMFSIARTLMWLETPSEYISAGWIIGQALLPYGQLGWDSGVHTPWNNTPQYVYGSMLVNDSAYCPSAALTSGHGCITFRANGSGTIWPEFLEFVEDELGASVVPCGWFTHLGAGLPGFSTTATDGDGPCLLPGGTTSTNTTAFQQYLTNAAPTEFDSTIALGNDVYEPQPQVRWATVGSGPYYLESVNQGQGYILRENPAYSQPDCTGQPNCYPVPGDYASNVYVFWDPNSVEGVEQYIAGQSDGSAFFPTDIPTILNLVHRGAIGLETEPTLSEVFEGFSYDFDPAQTQAQSGETTNIPGNFFSYVGMREFFAQAFPYATYITVDNTEDGIPFIQGVGGATPQYLGDYYPENISWPGMNTSAGLWPQVWQDPDTGPGCAGVVGSACWWWANITSIGSPYYDPEAVACESTSCMFPLGSVQGEPAYDEGLDAWGLIIGQITHGAIVTSRWDPTWDQLILNFGDAPGTSPFATYLASWNPDYPDPTDYMAPYYLPDGTFTYFAALNETFVGDDFGGTYDDCSAYSAPTFADLAYWANYVPLVPQACQGTAYSVMTWALVSAAEMPEGAQRLLYYNLAEHVADGLALFAYLEQVIGVGSYASWIDPGDIDSNIIIPGNLWFTWNGIDVVT